MYVNDGNPCRIIQFDNRGNYREKEIFFSRLGFKNVNTPMVVAKGNYMAFSYNPGTKNTEGVLLTVDPPQSKLLYSFDRKQIIMENGSSLVGTYYGAKNIHDMDSRHLVFGCGQVFTFHVFDKNGNPMLKVVDKKRTQNFFSPAEIKELKNEICRSDQGKEIFKRYSDKIIRAKHVVSGIKIDGERIYVFTVEDTTVKDRYPVEIYNLKGEPVKKGTMYRRPEKICRNFAYFKERDSDDNPVIVKYKILD